MADREKVIKGLECCTFILGKRKCNECPYQKGLPDNGCYQLQDDFHAILKEQEAVVHCAKCRYAEVSPSGLIKCNGIFRSKEWFCADGERKDSN